METEAAAVAISNQMSRALGYRQNFELFDCEICGGYSSGWLEVGEHTTLLVAPPVSSVYLRCTAMRLMRWWGLQHRRMLSLLCPYDEYLVGATCVLCRVHQPVCARRTRQCCCYAQFALSLS